MMSCIVDFPRPYSFDKEVYDCPISCLQHISSFFSIDTTFLLHFVLGIPATSELSDGLDAMFIVFKCEYRNNFDYLGGTVDGAFS